MSGTASIDRQIRDVIPAWLEAVRRKDTAAIAQFYTPDGRFLVPNAPIAEGRTNVAEMWGKLLSLPNVSLTFGPVLIEASVSGDMAYEIAPIHSHSTGNQAGPRTAGNTSWCGNAWAMRGRPPPTSSTAICRPASDRPRARKCAR